MKKILLCVSVAGILSAILMSYAFAEEFDRQADSLNRLGVLRGSTNGFQLQRAPTRLEAVILVSRLLPDEDRTGTHPFIDVPEWADPFVGFLYRKGIIRGSSSQFFRPFEDCSADMYLTFLLRTLGYSEQNGDFDMSAVRTVARSTGLLDSSMLHELEEKPFLRGHMAALSFEAFSCHMANAEETTLFDAWKAKNGQTEAAAEMTALFQTCETIETALSAMNAQVETEVHSSCSLTLIPGEEYSEDVVEKIFRRQDREEAYSEVTYQYAGVSGWSKLYYKDGTAYVRNSKNEKLKTKAAFDALFPADSPGDKLPLGSGQIISYTQSLESGSTRISLTVDGSLYNGKINLKSEENVLPGDKVYGDITFIYTIGGDGLLENQTLEYDFLYVAGETRRYGIYKEAKTFIKEEEITPIVFPAFIGYRDVAA